MTTQERTRRALSQAIRTNAAATVRRLGRGTYAVPSASEPGVTYVVRGTAADGSDHTCTCPAGSYGRPCRHAQAVRLRRVQEEARRQWRRIQARRAAQEVAA